MKTRTLDKVFPIYKVEQNCILTKGGDVTVAFQVELPEIFSLSSEEFESIHETWVKAIKVLPDHSVLHKQDWFVQRKYKADFSADDPTFSQHASELFFNERPFLDHSCYLFLSKRANERRQPSSLTSSLITGVLSAELSTSTQMTEEFLEKASQFEKIVSDGGFIKLRRLTDDELASSEEAPGLIERYCLLQQPDQQRTIKDIQLVPELKIGNMECRVFSLASVEHLPNYVGPRVTYDKYSTDRTRFTTGFAAPVSQLLQCNHIYNQYILVDDARVTIKKMEAKKLRLQSLAGYSRDNALSRDATNAFLNEAITTGRQPIKGHFNVITWSDNPEERREITNQVASAFTQLGANTKEETVSAAQLYWAALPGNATELPLHETFTSFSEQACCFFNNETNYQTSLSPVGMRLGDRLTGFPLNVDLSDFFMAKGTIQNRNKFVLSSSGAGKSFFCGHYLRSYWQTGAHIVVVDVGHSYRTLCDTVGGYYFTYEESNPIRFNPFYSETGAMDTEKKESLKTLLLSLWKKDDEPYTRAEYVTLSNALQGYFQHLSDHPQLFPCFNTFYEYLRDIFVVTLREQGVTDRHFDLNNLLYVFRPYYQDGEFHYLLNARENLDVLDQRFIVFELDNIKDHPLLLSTVTLIVTQIFLSKMRKLRGVRKIILIEEAWKAISKEGMAEYIKYLFKTVRKFFGEAIVVTQDVDDIISSPVIKDAIINNSDCKILLDQSKYINKFNRIQEVLGLTDKDKTMILSLNKANEPGKKYKEIFVGLGSSFSRVYRVEVSLEEYLMYTTDEREKVQVQAYAAKYGDMQTGIIMLAKHLRQQSVKAA